MQQKDAAVRKRVQISNANKIMFLWVVVSSIVVGSSVVAGVFLTQRLIYNEKVIAKKNETISILKNNIDAVDTLKQEIRKLDVNEALLSARANPEDQAVRAILDALPSEANNLALGASLQSKLIENVDGIKLDSLQIDPIQDYASAEEVNPGEEVGATSSGETATVPSEISFSFTVAGSMTALQRVLENLENSLRTIGVTSVQIEGQSGGEHRMTVNGRAFYLPARDLQFFEEPIK